IPMPSITENNHQDPKVSLLVAMRDEAGYISHCLRSLMHQDYPADRLEVLIYDGESEDGSWDIAESLIQNRPNFYLHHNPERIQSAAWNLGITKCTGDIIGIVSAHAELAPDYVSQAVETLNRTGVDMVGGPVRAVSGAFIGRSIALAMSTPFGVGGASFRYTTQEKETDTVFMGLCRRAVYQKVGGFDLDLVNNQDDEFSYRLQKSRFRIICNPAIKSIYYSRSTLRSLWKQYFRYGFWKVRVLQKHPLQMRFRHFIPPLFVLSILSPALLGLLWPPAGWLLLLGITAYLFANLAASLRTAQTNGWNYFPLLPLVFLILHSSYGLGFLVGLVYFANRWGDKEGKVFALEQSSASPQEA
ncbi:MAG: glycosyltransferase family 2 protein, partial [Chloroflexota bacterium]